MTIINVTDNDQTIVNTAQLARGTGSRYLEVMTSHKPNILIALQWRRTVPPNTKENIRHILIDMSR